MTAAPSVDPIDQKIDLCFGHADVNNDGVVDGSDVLGIAARIIAALDEPFGSAKAVELLQVSDLWWKGMAAVMDTNGDGVIEKDEYRVHMRQLMESGQGVEDAIRPLAGAIAKLLDRNDDGKIDAAEFAYFQRAMGTSDEFASLAFEKLDTNGDGSLSVDELVAAFRDYYVGTDPGLLGNWLYGGTVK